MSLKVRISRKLKITLVVLFGVVLVLHITLPLGVKYFINSKLAPLHEYRGHVQTVYLELWRGAFRIHDFKIEKINHEVPIPFIDIAIIDFTLNWSALFDGRVVAKMGFIEPKINFVEGPTEATSQAKLSPAWQESLKALIPIDLNLFWVRGGQVHFRNFHSEPKVDIFMDGLRVTAKNLSNAKGYGKELFGDASVDARIMKTGNLHVVSKLDPLAKPPTAKMAMEVHHVSLKDLNPFFRAYGKFDVTAGELDVYSEVATTEGKLEGYVKPFFREMAVLGPRPKDASEKVERIKGQPTQPNPLWENIVAVLAEIFKNHPHDAQAARIPFHGDLKNIKVDVFSAAWSAVSNAFLTAEKPGIEHSVSLKDLKAKSK